MNLPPYNHLLRIGRSIEPQMPKRMDLADIGRLTGQTRQAVYNESLIVLGKVVWLLRKAIAENEP